jgi:hypothetical protein
MTGSGTERQVGEAPTVHRWTVSIDITETRDAVTARARLRTGDTDRLTGSGSSRLDAVDRAVPEIGAELAAARALADLGRALFREAGFDLEAFLDTAVRRT